MTENYAYDDAYKLSTVKIGGVTQKSYGYDTAGRTTSVVSSAGTTTLAYDYEGRISTIMYPSSATNTFAYNGLDTRVSKVDSAGTSTFKRDGAGVTAPVLSDGGATYTPGISERRSSTTTFLHSGLKNADSQSGTGQTVTATKQYDAFGNVLANTGTWKGPFGYAGSFGYQEDVDSSLKLLGHRYYDASTGRFLTRDPIKDGRNWYVYCDSNPVRNGDPTGLRVFIGFKVSAAAVIGIDFEVGFVINDDGSKNVKVGGKITIGPQVEVGYGPTIGYTPTNGAGSDSEGLKIKPPFSATDVSIGPVDVTGEVGEPISVSVSPARLSGGVSTTVIGFEWITPGSAPSGGSGPWPPSWPSERDWRDFILPRHLLLR